MRTLKFYFVAVLTLVSILVNAQKELNSKLFESLPQNLELNDELQKFKVTTTHYNGDIFGHFFNKIQICGEYTRGLENGMVRWNKVSVTQSLSTDRNANFPEATPINYMENFSYKLTDDMLKPQAFESFGEHSAYTKNLVWDMFAIEAFAWSNWDNLKLNKPYSADEINGKIDLAGQGNFENKDVQLLWTGISIRNGENCAILEFRTFNNPLEVTAEGMNMKGRSHYWGTIWVSLADKQIEHAVLYEDVILEMILPGQTQKSIINATREINYKRILE